MVALLIWMSAKVQAKLKALDLDLWLATIFPSKTLIEENAISAVFDNNSKFWRSLFALLLVQVDRCGGGGVRSAAPGDRMTVGVVNDWFLARVATISLVSVSTTTDDQLYKLVLNQSQRSFSFFVCILTTQSTFYVCYRVVIKICLKNGL